MSEPIKPKLMSADELSRAKHACDDLLQRSSGSVAEAKWRRRVLSLLAHIAALERHTV